MKAERGGGEGAGGGVVGGVGRECLYDGVAMKKHSNPGKAREAMQMCSFV